MEGLGSYGIIWKDLGECVCYINFETVKNFELIFD